MESPSLLDGDLLRSRVARRLLSLFVLCALLPTGALALVAFGQVRHQLDRESRDRLHETAKGVGLALHERLLFLETALQPLAARLAGEPDDPRLPPELLPHLHERFVAMSLADGEGSAEALFGTPPGPLRLTAGQREHVEAGGTAVIAAGDESPRVLLVRRAGPWLLVAEVEPVYLFRAALDATDGDGQEFCVLDHEYRPVSCSSPGGGALPPDLHARVAAHASGDFDWSVDGERHLGRWWVLFLESRFASPSWTVVLGHSHGQVFAALHQFTRSFVAIVGLSLGVVLLLSLGQIRRSLGPLRQLLAGTRRLARRDFDTPVDVHSGDEFQQLAEAFNAMAGQISRQFRTLAARSDLDRAILSSMDLQTIIDTVLERVPRLHPCDAVALIVLDAPSSITGRSHLAVSEAPRRRRRDEVALPLDAVTALESGGEMIVDLVEEGAPPHLKPLAHAGVRSVLVLPVRTGRQLVGLLALGRRDAPGPVGEDRTSARQLADHVAVAFANAQMLERVRFLAYHDPLTKLPNRRRFTEDLEGALDRARRRGASLAVIFFDLDDFKRVNDTLGHGVGDALLRAVAHRVRERVCRSPARPEYELARLGGDEFTLLAPDMARMEEASEIAEVLLTTLTEPFRLGSHEVFVSVSVGIAMYPFDGDEATMLMKNADTAMHAAKELGKNRHQFYTRSMNEAAVERVTLEGQLRRALEEREFELYYQPIIDLRSGRLTGAEALLRWRHPELGVVRPASFIRVAEEMGLIVPLGDWVLRAACATARTWEQRSAGPLSVSVNLSARQFREEKLVETVARALTGSGLRPDLLWLEITESMLMRGDTDTVQVLRSLRSLGVRVAVDDFGTGYSSLAYLKQFPVDSLKIDRSFVRDVARETDDAAITRAVIAMGQSLQLKVVAEGVESQEQLDFLRRHGCDAIQGELIGMPMPAADFTRFFVDGTLG